MNDDRRVDGRDDQARQDGERVMIKRPHKVDANAAVMHMITKRGAFAPGCGW